MTQVADKTQIIELEEQLLNAMIDGDIDRLDQLIHDDLLFVIPTGQTITKEMDLANMRSGNLKIKSLIAKDQQIQLHDSIAIVAVEVELKGSFMDQPIDGAFKYIRTWKAFDAGWKIIAGSGIALQ